MWVESRSGVTSFFLEEGQNYAGKIGQKNIFNSPYSGVLIGRGLAPTKL